MTKSLRLILLILACALGAAAWRFRGTAKPASASPPSLTVYCAAGLKKPAEAIAAQFREETGVTVQFQYGPTGALLSQLRAAQRGDLFLAADDGAIADARKYDVIREVLPLVSQSPVIAVRAGNPKNIRAIADLLRDDVKLALTNPDSASISRVSQAVLGETWKKLAARAAMMKPAVTEVAADLSLGTVDAAILWDATVPQFKDIEAIAVPELSSHSENSSAAVLTACAQPSAALRFAR